jgi:chaperonin GroEL
LFIIATDISDDVASNLVFNCVKDILELGAITLPAMGDYSKLLLEDLALITGGKVITLPATNADAEEKTESEAAKILE